MVRLRGRFLSCFYCGKRTTIKFDGILSEFTCTNCEATNYLDEDGEITDPPAVESVSPKQYAVPSRATSPAASNDDSIFCQTCLKNQRLFTASLAQYLPDDPSYPDYAELERKYYRFRKDLEKRYPQVCADCAGKVESRIRQAGYTAKTDHLRRMMDKSRSRKAPTRTTPLDLANLVGRCLWWGGLLMQMLWHLVNIAHALEQQQEQQQPDQGGGMYDPDEKKNENASSMMMMMMTMIIARLSRFVASLPDADTLISRSIAAGFLSAWWNPHFVQVNRGFTRHLLGFTQWYSFQGLIIFLRYLFRAVIAMQGGKAQSKQAQLSVHLAMAAIMCLIYSFAKGSIKVDTAPLFGPSEKTTTTTTTSAPVHQSPVRKFRDEPKTLAEALTEALDTLTPKDAKPKRNSLAWQGETPLLRPPGSNNLFYSSRQSREQTPASVISNMDIFARSPQKKHLQDPDEMDWSPIPARSAHRAFQQSPSKLGSRPFGQTPTQPNANTFWYKVPPAPVNPAQRLRNPPNAPFLRTKQQQQQQQQHDEETSNLHFLRSKKRLEQDHGRDSTSRENSVDFKEPSFFAPEKSDEANLLVDVFNSSFTLGQEPQEGEETEATVENTDDEAEETSNPLPSSCGGHSPYELCTLAALFPSSLLMSLTAIPYRKELQLASLGLAGIIAAQGIGNGSHSPTTSSQSVSAAMYYVVSALSLAELGAIFWALWQVWTFEDPAPWYGTGILGLMLGHQLWGYFM